MLEISGTWKAQKSIPFLGSGQGTVAIFPDGFAKGYGRVEFLGKVFRFNADTIHIEPVDQYRYRATYLGKSVVFTVNSQGTVLSAVINPYRMGIVSIKRLDISIPLQFTRV